MKTTYLILPICLLLLSSSLQKLYSQDKYDADLESPDALIKALYASISGEKGVARDWDRFRNLFVDGAQLIPSRKDAEGKVGLQIMSPDQYVERARDYLEKEGFFEEEIHRVMESYGSLVHVWSTYDSRRSASDAKPFARGINSIQLLHDGQHWRVLQIYWLGETEENPIPKKYLP